MLTCITSMHLQGTFMILTLALSPLETWWTWHSERLSHLHRNTQLGSSGVKLRSRSFWLPSPHSQPLPFKNIPFIPSQDLHPRGSHGAGWIVGAHICLPHTPCCLPSLPARDTAPSGDSMCTRDPCVGHFAAFVLLASLPVHPSPPQSKN